MRNVVLLYLSIFIFPVILSAQSDSLVKGWPRVIQTDKGKVVIYQPQIESFTGDLLEARAAISVTTVENPAPVFGAMWFDCRMSTDRDERTVTLLDVKVSAAKFPEVKEESVDKLITLVEEEVPEWDIVLSLDRLLADLEMDLEEDAAEGFNNEAPEIIFKSVPSVLILIDGDPIWVDTDTHEFQIVVNSPFFIVKDLKQDVYYINGAGLWYESEDPKAGWKHIESPPKKVNELAAEMIEDPEEDPEEPEGASEDNIVPEILVRTKPAELLQSFGEPEFEPIPETSLLFMKNTDDDILMDINTQKYYILVSGRWYKSASLTSNEWEFIHPDKVPEDFSRIPGDSEMAAVRSSVAGTQEAKEAVLENQIPQTAEVSREDATLTVTYDGKPEFKTIEGTNMQYAVNTEQSVLKIDGRYYCCDNAVWFESGSAEGPWSVAVSIPDDVQEIPPASPVYNVKYVYIYDYTPSVVYVGYTPGYVHSYVYMGTVYYGTGWYYSPWYRTYYYPRPVTYGFRVHYNPYTGWGFGMTVSRGWMTVSFRSHPGYWGPAGYRHGYRHGYHHGYHRGRAAGYRAGYNAGQRNAATNNVYKNRANGVSRTGGSSYNPRTGQAANSNRPATKPEAKPSGGRNNVYTDKNGNVYRKEGNNWQSRENGQWKDSSPGSREGNKGQPATRENNRQGQGQATTTDRQANTNRNDRAGQGQQGNYNRSGQNRNYNDLNRDANSRSRGSQRTNNYNQNRQNYQYQGGGSGNRSTSRPRSGGGSARPGGRRR